MVWVLCSGLRAWWLAQLWLVALLQSLIASRGSGVRRYDGSDLKLFNLVGWDRSSVVCCSADNLLLLQISSGVVWQSRDLQLSRKT